jgi:hypothetical protein
VGKRKAISIAGKREKELEVEQEYDTGRGGGQ